MSGMAGEPPSSFVEVFGRLKWAETEEEFSFSLGDATEIVIEGMVVHLRMANDNEDLLQAKYQAKRRTFRENELKRRLSFPEHCGELASSKVHPNFIRFTTKKGCATSISKHTGNVLHTFFYID